MSSIHNIVVDREPNYNSHLRDIGRRRADAWLAANLDRVGIEATVDVRARYI